MIPTFVIGLREGLEAALIVGIIATFLSQQGRRDALRQVWIGVGIAVLICLGIGITLEIVSADLPQRQQEGLATVIGALAVAMVTWMIMWMRKHARHLKGHLQDAAAAALASGSAYALVVMAFLAVLREGFETAVFLVAVINQPGGDGALAGTGAILGILVSAGIGWGIYRGGVKLNMAKFFKATGLVLVVVAAGLVMTTLHTAHGAGWLNVGQARALDLTWLVHPGTPLAALFTGVLGIQVKPSVIEVAGWLVYVVPLLLIVALPGRRRPTPRPAVGTDRSPSAAPSATIAQHGA